jgi:hypothetical protein
MATIAMPPFKRLVQIKIKRNTEKYWCGKFPPELSTAVIHTFYNPIKTETEEVYFQKFLIQIKLLAIKMSAYG